MSERFAATLSHPEVTMTAFSKLKPLSIIHIACYVALDQRLGSLGNVFTHHTTRGQACFISGCTFLSETFVIEDTRANWDMEQSLLHLRSHCGSLQ